MTAYKQMASGRLFPVDGFTAADIDIMGDVAPALARIQRFGGALRIPFSVAEHSLMMAGAAAMEGRSEEVQLALLLHDAHEAYLGDITTPAVLMLCCEFAGYADADEAFPWVVKSVKDKLDEAISLAAHCECLLDAQQHTIADYDLRALDYERRHFMAPAMATDGVDPADPWGLGNVQPMPSAMERAPETVRLLTPDLAERVWREEFTRLQAAVTPDRELA